MSPRMNPFDEDVKFLEGMFEQDMQAMAAIVGDAAPMNKQHLTKSDQEDLRKMLTTDPEVNTRYVKKYGQRLVDEFVGGGA